MLMMTSPIVLSARQVRKILKTLFFLAPLSVRSQNLNIYTTLSFLSSYEITGKSKEILRFYKIDSSHSRIVINEGDKIFIKKGIEIDR